MWSLCVCVSLPHNNFWMPESIFMKFGMYIMRTWAHLNSMLHKSLPFSLHVYMCIPISFLGNRSVKIPLSLLGNGSVKTLRRQQIHM
jgi:hypothetical protein